MLFSKYKFHSSLALFRQRSLLLFFALTLTSSGLAVLSACKKNASPETQVLVRELEDSLSVMMQIRDDDEFFRRYIAYNVRFTVRHKFALNDTVLSKELKSELAKMALIQAAQDRVDKIQKKNY